jgi:Tol biopolymer transport system component
MKPSAVSAFAAVLATALTCVPAADAAFPGRNGRVALERFEPGNPRGSAILGVRRDGSAPVRLGDGSFPSWSANGRWVAFSTGGISVAKADGSSRRVVTPDGYEPAWAPSGKSLAFVRDLEADESAGFPTLFRMNADGSGLTQLVQGHSPSWSPSGGRIAYASEDSLWLIQSDGKRRERIYRTGRFIVDVDWAPDGRSLLVVRQVEGTRDTCEIVRVSIGGRKLGTLLRAKAVSGAAWAPDGRSVVYSRADRVYTRAAGGGSSSLVGAGNRPSWQPLKR